MKVEGRCHCGKIAYEAQVDPDKVMICHCTDCQTLTGAAYRVNVQAPAETFVLLSGLPKIYIKTAESGNQRAQAFCPDCGTPIYATTTRNPVSFSLRVGALKQRAQLHPSSQYWFRSALPWSADIHALKTVERQ